MGNLRTIGGLALALCVTVGCSGNEDTANLMTPVTTGTGGSTTTGGMALPTGGMALPSGGMALPTGGMALPSGGMALPSGGMALPSGGMATGGATAGGEFETGGTATGGMATGGEPATGGTVVEGDPTACKWTRGADPTEASIMGTTTGPYKVETYTTGFMKGAGVDSSTVHYPTDAEPPFAGVAVVPGFVSPESSIKTWGPFLASHGIVTVTIGVPGGDQPPTRAQKLLSTIEGLKAENSRSGSPLEGKLALGCMGVSGWSMGGGGTLIAASGNPNLKAAVSFAAWGPSGGRANQVPALMFQATADGLAANMSNGFYRDTPDSTPKMLFEVQGSSHNVANSPSNHTGIIGAYGLSWWKVFLEGDERYRQFLTRPFPSITTAVSAHNLN